MGDRTERKTWEDFREWCRHRRIRPMPAHPWTVAAYLRWCETRHRYPTILNKLEIIGRQHVLKGAPSPADHSIVARTLETMAAKRARKRPALFSDADFQADLDQVPDTTKEKPEKRHPLSSTPKLVRKK